MRITVLCASFVGMWAGTALLLSQLRWFQRRPTLATRLRPYAPEQAGIAEAQEWLRNQ